VGQVSARNHPLSEIRRAALMMSGMLQSSTPNYLLFQALCQ
jgi:hypothetical protein